MNEQAFLHEINLTFVVSSPAEITFPVATIIIGYRSSALSVHYSV